MHPPPPINSTVMLVTAIIGFACNVTNLVALNCACGAEEEDDEDEELVDDEMGEDLNLTISNRNEIYKKKPAAPLSESLSGVYKIRQAHKGLNSSRAHHNENQDEEGLEMEIYSVKTSADELEKRKKVEMFNELAEKKEDEEISPMP